MEHLLPQKTKTTKKKQKLNNSEIDLTRLALPQQLCMKLYLCFSNQKPIRQLFSFLAIVCGFVVIAILLQLFFFLVFSQHNQDIISKKNMLFVFQGISQIGIFLCSSLFFAHYYSNEPLRKKLFLQTPKNQSDYLKALLVLALAYPFLTWIGYVNYHIDFPPFLQKLESVIQKQEQEQTLLLKQMLLFSSPVDFLLTFCVMSLLPAVCEELFFRSTFNSILFRITKNINLSIFITAFLFSYIHFQFLGFLPRFFIGIILSFFLFYSNSILPSLLLHFLFNGAQVVVIYVANDPLFTERCLRNEDVQIPAFVGVLSFVLFALSLYYLYQQRLKTKL